MLFWLIAADLALVPTALGRAAGRAGKPWMSPHLAALLVVAAAGGLVAALAHASPESGSPRAGADAGVVLFLMLAAPLVAFYSLGHRVRRLRVLAPICLGATVPLLFYGWLVLLALVIFVDCADEACALA
jgi:hypothetical protein